jgi:hypothetical protein
MADATRRRVCEYERGCSMSVRRTFGLSVLVLFLAACGSHLNQENFDKVREGMSQKEVREILGEPVDASGASLLGVSGGESVWKDDKTVITVHFLNEKVVSKRMSPLAAVAQAEKILNRTLAYQAAIAAHELKDRFDLNVGELRLVIVPESADAPGYYRAVCTIVSLAS